MEDDQSQSNRNEPINQPSPGIHRRAEEYEYYVIAGDPPFGDEDCVPKPISIWVSTQESDYPVISETGDRPAVYDSASNLDEDDDQEPLSDRARKEIGRYAAEIIDQACGRHEIVEEWCEECHPSLDVDEKWAVRYVLRYVAEHDMENDAIEALVADCVVRAAIED